MNDGEKVTAPFVARSYDEQDIGGGLAVWCGGATFVASWIACMQEYGFLFGFGLGWLPSAMLAAVVGVAVNYLWAYILGLFAFAIIAIWFDYLL